MSRSRQPNLLSAIASTLRRLIPAWVGASRTRALERKIRDITEIRACVRAVAAYGEFSAMKAENEARALQGLSPAYGDDQFSQVAERYGLPKGA